MSPMNRTAEHAAKKTDINEHLPTLYRLVVGLHAQRVLELGVRTGESTVALLEGLQETGGEMLSVDIAPCTGAQALIARYGLGARWTFQQADDLALAATWDKARLLDLIFVDTSHLYEQTRQEIAAFEPLLRPGGLLVFHDTVSFKGGVLKPIEEFLATRPAYRFEHHPNNNGLGIVTKPA